MVDRVVIRGVALAAVCLVGCGPHSHKYVTVTNNAASLDLDITDELLPNAYVTAVLFRKIKDRQIPLLAGHGFAPILVEKASNKIALTISAPERIRPKTKHTITVNAGRERGCLPHARRR